MSRITRTVYDENQQEWITTDYNEQKQDKQLKTGWRKVYKEFEQALFFLSGTEPRVLSYILQHANKNNQLYITYKQLSKKIKLSERQVKRNMKKLKDKNIVHINSGQITINPFMYNKGGSKSDVLMMQYIPLFKKDCK